jgi:hypothetical protein
VRGILGTESIRETVSAVRDQAAEIQEALTEQAKHRSAAALRCLARRGDVMGYVAMSGVREEKRRDVTLRPGVIIPVIGYLGSLVAVVLAAIAVAHPGPDHSLAARWIGGQVLTTGAWLFYKFGSQRIVLAPDTMRVISFFQIGEVRRGAVLETDLNDDLFALVIALTDGSTIEPLMFLLQGRAGLTPNAMSRRTISDQIMEWSAGALPDTAGSAGPLAWRQVRLNMLPLLASSALVAIEALALTAANIR